MNCAINLNEIRFHKIVIASIKYGIVNDLVKIDFNTVLEMIAAEMLMKFFVS